MPTLAFDGAGIFADASSVNLSVAFVNANAATNNGGAIYLAAGSTLTASDGFIGSITSGGGSTALNWGGAVCGRQHREL